MKKVSVIAPIYNEEKYIENCIESLLEQDYPKKDMEWIFVDGSSSDNTLELLNNYTLRYPELIKVYNNKFRTVPYAMNIGIENSKGSYIIRIDAHSKYENDYISNCVYYLDNTDAVNVGGIAETCSEGVVGNAIAKMLTSKFGVGGSKFRTSNESGYVDTVPFGAFRRKVFSDYGLYDVRLTRNQDNELNYRIRKNGGKIFLSNKIKFTYYPRSSFKGICKMAFQNGKWNIITTKLCPGTMGLRHFIPLIFVASIITLPLLSFYSLAFFYIFILEIMLYFVINAFESIRISDSINDIILLFVLFPSFHVSYGVGSLMGIFKLFFGGF